MSITLHIKNKDTRSAAVVVVRRVHTQGDRKGLPTGDAAIALRGGDEADLLIHSGSNIVIEEICNG